ncbi:unnamed protein product [Camellia sinensis]
MNTLFQILNTHPPSLSTSIGAHSHASLSEPNPHQRLNPKPLISLFIFSLLPSISPPSQSSSTVAAPKTKTEYKGVQQRKNLIEILFRSTKLLGGCILHLRDDSCARAVSFVVSGRSSDISCARVVCPNSTIVKVTFDHIWINFLSPFSLSLKC